MMEDQQTEDDRGGTGAVGRGRLVYTCNGAGAFEGNSLGEDTGISEERKEVRVGKRMDDAGDSN